MIFLSAHVGLIYFSYSLSRTTLLVYGAIGLFCYYVSVNFQFSKRIVVSRSVVYSHALMAVRFNLSCFKHIKKQEKNNK